MESIKRTITNFQAANFYKLSQTKEFGLISFKHPKEYLWVQKNVKNMKELYEFLAEAEKKAIQPSVEYVEFESERIAAISPYLVKDEQGNVFQDENGGVKPIDGMEKTAEVIFKGLIEKHRPAIEEHNAKLMAWTDFLNSDCETQIILIPFDDVTLPEEGFNKNKFDILSLMLDDSEV